MKETTATIIPQHIQDYNWNEIRNYAKDLEINIVGLKREAIEELVTASEELTKQNSLNANRTSDELVEDVSLTDYERMTALVRCRVTNKCPTESKLKSVPFTVGSMLGGFPDTRIIPFGSVTHLPRPVLSALRTATFSQTEQVRNQFGSITDVRTIQAPHYFIEVLPPLSLKDLDKLAKEQKDSGRLKPLNE